MLKKMVLMLLVLPMVFQSCSKDDDDVVSLPGTKWVCNLSIEGFSMKTTLWFIDGTRFQTVTDDESPDDGTYTVSGSKITLTYEDGSTAVGTIKGSTITFVDPEIPIVSLVFKKQ